MWSLGATLSWKAGGWAEERAQLSPPVWWWMRAISSNHFSYFWHRSPGVFIEGSVAKINDRAKALHRLGSPALGLPHFHAQVQQKDKCSWPPCPVLLWGGYILRKAQTLKKHKVTPSSLGAFRRFLKGNQHLLKWLLQCLARIPNKAFFIFFFNNKNICRGQGKSTASSDIVLFVLWVGGAVTH